MFTLCAHGTSPSRFMIMTLRGPTDTLAKQNPNGRTTRNHVDHNTPSPADSR